MIEVVGLRKTFGERVAVDSVTLRIAGGEVFGLLGPNGAGKTTTLSMLSTQVRPDAGEIRIGGVDAVADPREARRRLGLVPQATALYEPLSAIENLTFLGRLYGLRGASLRQRCWRLLEQIGLANRGREPVRTFSGGMKRRLSIVCALVHSPAALLLDEPAVGLDAQSRAHLLELVGELRRQEIAVVYTTHLMNEAERICDRLAILDRGQVLAEGTPVEIVAAHGKRVVEVQEPSLETAFLALTGRRLRD